MLSSRIYDILKYIAQMILPTLATMIFGIGQIWGFPTFAEQIVGTISIIDAALGIFLGIDTHVYNGKNNV